jgi:hypothetical protein
MTAIPQQDNPIATLLCRLCRERAHSVHSAARDFDVFPKSMKTREKRDTGGSLKRTL